MGPQTACPTSFRWWLTGRSELRDQMLVIPAVDLRDGRCVRCCAAISPGNGLDDDPVRVACHWTRCWSSLVHVVDLDGARAGRPVQLHWSNGSRKAVVQLSSAADSDNGRYRRRVRGRGNARDNRNSGRRKCLILAESCRRTARRRSCWGLTREGPSRDRGWTE